MKSQKHLLSKLFISTLYLSAFTFWRRLCNRYTHEKKFVDQYHWIDDEEMLDLIAIAQSSPGAIAVNGAIVVGYKLAGIPGVLLCVLATVLPPFVIISILSVFYAAFQSNVWIRLLLEGMQSGVAAVIASVVYDMGRGIIREKTPISLLIMGGAFLANYMFQINAVYIIFIFVLHLAACRPGIRKGGHSHDLPAAFFQFSSNRNL